MDFAIRADHIVKLKESKKKDKYLHLAREQKKLWNMKVTVLLTVNAALGTVSKGLVQRLEELEIRGRVEPIQTTELLRSARMLRKFLGNLRRLAVTQTPVRNHQFVLMWKNLYQEKTK